MNLKRSVEKNLKKWYEGKHRKPLVIRGARQVGKSTLVRDFAKAHNLVLYEVNFERFPGFGEVFKKPDIAGILREIEYLCGKGKVNPQNSIIFLDEIQAAPLAVKALRYFYEDFPGLAVIAAGSLLEFTLADFSYSMPVGRIEYLFLGPMTFEEFLQAKGEKRLLDLIREYDFSYNFPVSAHNNLLQLQREYLLVGGMPEAVQRYVETGDINEVIDVHSSIIETYRDDFAKYAKGAALLRLQKVFDYVPAAAGEKIKYRNIDENSQARDLREAVEMLVKAAVITCVYHSKSSGIPLRVGKNDKIFKLYFLDIGLMNRVCGIQNIPLQKLESREFVNQGKMAEQFVGQHLLYSGRRNETPRLFYWLREGRSTNAEVDFVIQVDSEIVPVEIKAGKSGSLKSLHRFIFEKKSGRAVRFDLNPPSVMRVSHKIGSGGKVHEIGFSLLSLPIYMVEQLPRIFRFF
ncbi:MAG: ATP-binding protein [Candidatus Aminicenantes bacterium]|nr:ATP-binding protein [Candidatus Aminicenantes bacterium]